MIKKGLDWSRLELSRTRPLRGYFSKGVVLSFVD